MTIDEYRKRLNQLYLIFYLQEDSARMAGNIEEADKDLIRLEVLAEALDLLSQVPSQTPPEQP